MKKKRISLKEFQENMKAIIHKPLSEKAIEKLNKIFDQDEEHEKKNRTPKKIAKLPEVDQ